VVERIAYDEFSLFHENADEYGIEYEGPPVVRRDEVTLADGRHLSALVWGDAPPEVVFLHGGAQNAHTWDTVALALRRPIVAIDLPGHGHSEGGREGSTSATANAVDVAQAIRALAPDALGVVGMSLGGLTTIALADHAPELVRSAVLVDVTPGVTSEKSRFITAFVNGPESFADFDEILARTIEHNPTRTESSLRRGILHNAVQRDDGSWVWRYARFRNLEPREEGGDPVARDYGPLWEALSRMTVPLMLVRGMQEQSVVDDADEVELLRRLPSARIERVDAGHSVQGDQPVQLAQLIDDFLPDPA
jgi:pimeloyl-ACP methyl ester carboxylesterase